MYRGWPLIPFAKNKDTFQLRESSSELPIVKWLVLAIQAILRSIIPEALTRSNMSLFFANGISALSLIIHNIASVIVIDKLIPFIKKKSCNVNFYFNHSLVSHCLMYSSRCSLEGARFKRLRFSGLLDRCASFAKR